jgi:hypothetical protein
MMGLRSIAADLRGYNNGEAYLRGDVVPGCAKKLTGSDEKRFD